MNDFAQAACIGHDGEMWFSSDPLEQAEATRICGTCSLRAACLERALNDEGAVSEYSRHGILGGKDPKERAWMRGPRPKPKPRALEQHGTPAGYRQHERAGTPKCPECIEAYAVMRRARRVELGHDVAKRRVRYLRSKEAVA